MFSSKLTALVSWIETHPEVLGWTGLFSLLMFVLSLVVIPMLIVKLPPDYLTACQRPRIVAPKWRSLYLVFKNTSGMLILLAGLAMLVLPGQGLLTILMALVLIDFPGKRRLVRRVMIQPKVLRTVNRLRKKAGKTPLSIEDDAPLTCPWPPADAGKDRFPYGE